MKLYIFLIILGCASPLTAFTADDVKKFFETAYSILDAFSKLIPLPKNAGKNITELAQLFDYQIEEHNIVTEDNYKLKIFRIPGARHENYQKDAKKPVVLLMHGILSSAADWINIGPNKSLGCILADNGYDVWLGNARGNKYSRNHTVLNPDKNASFWEFSFHEQGVYDLPATIDYILNQTGASKLSYIGHSEGTTNFFVMGSEKPAYNNKINIMVALAPVAYMTNMSSPLLRMIDDYLDILMVAIDVLKINEIPSSNWIRLIGVILCNDRSGLQFICVDLMELLVGFDNKEMNSTILPVILTNYPAGSGIRQLIHYGQEIKSGHFRQYDYGLQNLAKYGKLSPPDYNVSAVSAPVALYYAENDLMSASCNVEQLAKELPNVVSKTLMEFEYFNHFDFIWATDVKTMLYDKVLDLLKKYNL